MTFSTLYAASPDGTRIAYDVAGAGPGLLLLHGAGKTRRDWHKLGYVERLKADFTVVSIDLRGTGDSDLKVSSRCIPCRCSTRTTRNPSPSRLPGFASGWPRRMRS